MIGIQPKVQLQPKNNHEITIYSCALYVAFGVTMFSYALSVMLVVKLGKYRKKREPFIPTT